MLGITIALISTLALGGTGIFVALKTMQNYKPGRKKIQKDIEQIRLELKPYVAELVPWSREEMEQLSLNQASKVTKKQITTSSKGIITTIYHEPVIAFAYKKYVSPTENAVLYARTSEREFIFRIKNGETELVIDNSLVGKIDAGGRLLSAKGNKMLASISKESQSQLLPVMVNGKEMGSIANPARVGKINPRAFEFLKKMEKDEEAVFLALAIFEMARREK